MKSHFSRVASDRNHWKAIFFVLVFTAAAGLPFYFGDRSSAQTTTTGTFYVANLTGPPIGTIIPRGVGHYFADSNNNRVFDTTVDSIALPAGTILGVFVDGTLVGPIRLGSTHSGSLRLSTGVGQTVPAVQSGSTLEVKTGPNSTTPGTTILSGVFGPPPSPTPTGSPLPTPSAVFFAPLYGPTVAGILPRGMASYAEFGPDRRRLDVFVDHILLPVASPTARVDVFINGSQVGQIVLNSTGSGALHLDTANGDTVPTVTAGSTAGIRFGTILLLAGTFRAPTTFPTPTPPPHVNHFFAGRLNGAQVVPPVTTDARGVIFVAVNDTEMQIRVWLGFAGLSSAQTTARIYGPAMVGETGPEIFDLGTVGGTSGRFPVQTFNVTAEQKEQLRNGLWYVQIGSADHPDGEIRGQIRGRTRPSGYAGIETDDIAVFRPSNATWYVKTDAGYTTEQLGAPGDVPVSADFDGDGITDSAVFRDGTWLISRSSDGGITTKQFGTAGDVPLRGDYDGDGIADLAVFRPSTGVWWVQKSSDSGYIIVQFGMNGDRPVASDIDGDGRTDITVFRPSTGTWYWLGSRNGGFGAVQFGMSGDVPIVGDFDGDGADDISVWRPTTGVWYISKSTGGYDIRQFGLPTDIPIAGNYDGDGMTDIAVFRPSTGVWYIWRSSDGMFDYRFFGTSGDIPTTTN